MSASTRSASPLRERRALGAATLTSGAEQGIDFILPLFAGAVLQLSARETGLLVAAGLLVAFLVRPFAGVVVDRFERTLIAAAGAAAYGVACGLYALSAGLPLALAAAVLSGAAGAFLWVAVRAIIGERLAVDSGAFARLVAAEETGGWLILVPAILILSAAGYQWVFLGMAVCCLVAAGILGTGRKGGPEAGCVQATGAELSNLSLRGLGRTLRPMLLAVVVTMTAEAAVSLLLMLHLQRGFHLGVIEIAYVFLPGAIAMGILPPYLHHWVIRYGRRRMLILGSGASALFAAGLAFAPSPPWIAALWVLSAVAWSVVIPVQQAVIAEAAGGAHLGRGLSLYEAASLAGAFVGSLAAGLLYQGGSWVLACIVCAFVIASGAAMMPAAVKRLGVADIPEAPVFPPAPPTRSHGAMSSKAAPCNADSSGAAPTGGGSARVDTAAPDAGGAAGTESPSAMGRVRKSRRRLLLDFAFHSALLGVALLLASLLLPGFSFPALLGIGPGSMDVGSSIGALLSGPFETAALIAAALRVWVIIYLVDAVWTGWKTVSEAPSQPPS